jgi:hypothetical protein
MRNHENPTFEAQAVKPEPYTAVRLYFADGSRKGGIWTGKVWWSEGRAVEPVRWERMTPLTPPEVKEGE